jgi:hypothetical protein
MAGSETRNNHANNRLVTASNSDTTLKKNTIVQTDTNKN